MNPILDIAKIKKWITNDTVLDHAPNTDTNEISVPHKIIPSSHPKIYTPHILNKYSIRSCTT
jgi:hypothetical protein